MRCQQHDLDAVGVCAWCGRGVCRKCVEGAGPLRLTCSPDCATALARQAGVLESLLERSRQTARANSVNYYVSGAVAAGATIAAWFWLPSPLLMWFTGVSAAALMVSGFWLGRVARKKP
jgi:hypothetical protein